MKAYLQPSLVPETPRAEAVFSDAAYLRSQIIYAIETEDADIKGISEMLGVTRSRASQLVRKAVQDRAAGLI